MHGGLGFRLAVNAIKGTTMTQPGRPNRVTERELVSVTGNRIAVPDPNRLAHLQFRRFAGCPICNLHLR